MENFQKYLRNNYTGSVFKTEVKPWEDWNSEWRKSFETIDISPRLRVVPEWERDNWSNNEEALFIYPGMGFGTGNHETTFLCLQFLDEIVFKRKEIFDTCLDFGCGSGILGIAALKLTKKLSVDFCDLEVEALENCKNNLEINFPNRDLDGSRLVSRERFSPEKNIN